MSNFSLPMPALCHYIRSKIHELEYINKKRSDGHGHHGPSISVGRCIVEDEI